MNRLFCWLTVAIFFLWSLPLSAAPAAPKLRPVTHPPFVTAKSDVFMRCPSPRVYDGDTIVCSNGYYLRLLGIQAPEIKCRPGLECVGGDGLAAKASLQAGMRLSKRVTYQYIRRDNRSRPVVIVRAGKVNLNCWQLARTDAILKYDARRLIERECGIKPAK